MSYSFKRIKVLITSKCNSNCTHCFRSAEKNTESISIQKLIEIIDFGVNNNCRHFGFSGGEFFTHPNCYDLINYCLNKQVKIKILTNALSIDTNFLGAVERKDLIAFQISVDGLEKSHDKRRGKGSYFATIENVKKLHSMGYKLSAKMIIDSDNYIDFPYVLKMPWFEKVLVLPLAFDEETNHNSKDFETEEYKNVIKIIYQKMTSINDRQNLCIGYPNELAIKYNGNVYPCTEAREHDEFLIGNITNQTLEQLLQKYENSDQEKLRCKDIKIKACEVCQYNNACNFGCRLRARRFNGDFASPDPFNCRIFNNKFSDVPIGKLIWGKKC